MTGGEKMFWAAVFARVYMNEEYESRPESFELAVGCAADAVEGLRQKLDIEGKDKILLMEMLSPP